LPDRARPRAGHDAVRSQPEHASGKCCGVVEGTSSEIGDMIHLSPKSVQTYRSRLMVKLGVSDVPSLVKFALEHGLTPPK
jgi:hypothetical protein